MKDLSKKVYTVLILNNDIKTKKLIDKAFSSLNFKFKTVYVSTPAEAITVLKKSNDLALILLNPTNDKTSETLSIVHYIRKELSDSMMRIMILDLENRQIDIDTINTYDISNITNREKLSYENIFSTIRNLLMQYKQLQQLEHKSADTYKQLSTDSLTHLYNRMKLNEDCSSNKEKTLILIDIIGFGKINENYGYSVGDLVLKEFAAFLYSMYHDNFNVYHLENDLFALIPTQNIKADIFKTVEDIRSDILKLNIITNNFNRTLDISIGVAYQSETNILRKAELALKEARNNGINKIKYYAEDLKILKQINNTNFWAPIIQENLDNSTIIVHYQPIHNLKTNTIDKYELLMRIQHKDKLYFPDSFLSAAYKAGQMYDIFKFMFTQACVQVQKTGLKFSINIGDSEFQEDGIVDFISDTLTAYKVDASLISLEILEYHSISNNKLIKNNIVMMHKLGLQIIIDDFGVKCSNFGQLQNLPISAIKIDGSFIKDIDTSKDSQIIVKTIQTFAKEKNIKLIAEFVCNQQVLESVSNLNIEYAQGNYLGAAQEKIDEI